MTDLQGRFFAKRKNSYHPYDLYNALLSYGRYAQRDGNQCHPWSCTWSIRWDRNYIRTHMEPDYDKRWGFTKNVYVSTRVLLKKPGHAVQVFLFCRRVSAEVYIFSILLTNSATISCMYSTSHSHSHSFSFFHSHSHTFSLSLIFWSLTHARSF